MEITKTRRSALKRGARNPSGHLSGTPAELAILELLRDYRYLPTPFIKAGVSSGPQYVEDTLTELVDKHYIGIPEEAVDRCTTRAVPHVYEILPRGLAFLAKNSRHTEQKLASKNWFSHDVLTSTVQFSFDIAPKFVPGLNKRDAQSILFHENCPEETRFSPAPFVIDTTPKLEADADPFGFEYNGRLVFFHGFEADNSTEVVRTTIKRKIDRYVEYLESKGPARMFGIPSAWMHILFITTSQDRAEHMAQLVPEKWADRFHFKATSGFNTKFPPPDARMVTTDWIGKDGKTWNILEHLGVPHGRIEEVGTGERARSGN